MKKTLPKILLIAVSVITINTNAQQNINNYIKVFFNHPVDTSRALNGNYATYITNSLSDTLAAFINRAKYTLDVAQYDYTSYGSSGVAEIATAINNAYARGVKIRWIDDGSSPNSGLNSFNSGIPTLASPTGGNYNIMHNKFIIEDVYAPDSTQAFVWTGSADWSNEMNTEDYNNDLYIQSKQLAQAYTQEFDFMWGDTTHGSQPNTALSKFGPYKPHISRHTFTIGGSEVELYFSPTDSVNTQIYNHILTANTDVYAAVYAFSETSDATAITNAYNKGAYAAAILDQYSLQYGAYSVLSNYLANDATIYSGKYIYHDKYMIVDPSNACSDPFVWTGSHNWTASANSTNDENSIVIHNDTIAKMYLQSFAEDFLVISGNALDTVHVACALGVNSINGEQITVNTYPNPYTDKVTVNYTLLQDEPVTIDVYNVMGQKVACLADGKMQTAGNHQLEYKAEAAGVYMLNIKAGQGSVVKKLVQVN